MFLAILDNSVPKNTRKAKLCWLLQNEAAKIRSDLSRRFVRKNTIVIHPTREESDDNLREYEIITRGDHVIVKMDQIFYIGQMNLKRFLIRYLQFHVEMKFEEPKGYADSCLDPDNEHVMPRWEDIVDFKRLERNTMPFIPIFMEWTELMRRR